MDEALDAETDRLDVAWQGLGRFVEDVHVEARVRIRTHVDAGRAAGLLYDAAPGRIALDDLQDGLAIGFRQVEERVDQAMEKGVADHFVDQRAGAGEEGFEPGERWFDAVEGFHGRGA